VFILLRPELRVWGSGVNLEEQTGCGGKQIVPQIFLSAACRRVFAPNILENPYTAADEKVPLSVV
jgi:hypothetical protein